MYGPKVFLLSKIKSEYSDILYNPTYFLQPLMCRIRQVLMYIHFWERYYLNIIYLLNL